MFDTFIIEIPPADIEALIRRELHEHYRDREITDFKFTVGMECKQIGLGLGDGAAEEVVPVFKGAIVRLEH